MASVNEIDYDIVIAGGGMIGTSLALALAPLKLNVAVVEPVEASESVQPSFDERSTALSRSTQRMFEAMDLWREVVEASTPIEKIHVSDQGRFGFAHIDAKQQKVEALGYVVINRVLGQVLRSHIDKTERLDWLSPARIVAANSEAERCAVVIEDASGRRQLTCELLIAADGSNSQVREMLGIGVVRSDYNQVAVIGNLLPEKPMRNIAYERFTESGPIAMLPIADKRAAFIWTVQANDAEEVLQWGDAEFTRELRQAFGGRLGQFSRVGERAAYPLALSKAISLTAGRGVLVGNAAHGLHPVAAQGFNLGMRDVAALCDCLFDTVRGGDYHRSAFDLGDASLLTRYADWRQDDHRNLVGFTDNLVKLFGSQKKSVKLLRNIGMLGFDMLPGVRGLFARHTMGLAGKLPRLSRGVPLTPN